MNLGIYLPKLKYSGGVEKVAQVLSTNLGVKIVTSFMSRDINDIFCSKKNNIRILGKNKEKSAIKVVGEFLLSPKEVDIMIYPHPRTPIFGLLRPEKRIIYLNSLPHHYFLDNKEYKHYFGKMPFYLKIEKNIWRLIMKVFFKNDVFLSNSLTTAKNFKKITGIEASSIVYPPIDTNKFKWRKSKGYFLSVTRFVSYKRIDWQIEAFKKIKKNLIIVGNGPLEEFYRKKIEEYPNIKILSNIKGKDIIKLYSECSAFIFTSALEHFGMSPLEAMASGKPVISVNEGGPREYIREGYNGYLFRNISELKKILKEKGDKDFLKLRHQCIKTAKKFNVKNFIASFKRNIKD